MQVVFLAALLLALSDGAQYPFLDTSLSWSDRVDDLVGRLTLEEVQDQLAYGGRAAAPGIPRLGIEHYAWWSNCGRGYVGAPGNATAFPQAIGLAATFDVNGVPVAANKWLLTDLIRGEWNFTGYTLSDGGAMTNMVTSFHYKNSRAEACAASLNAGLNIDVPGREEHPYCLTIVENVQSGALSEHLVRERLKPLFYTRMRLGEFDPPAMNPYTKYTLDMVESPAHQKLALEAAMKSFVLLKNKGVLPLQRNHYANVALVGPFADDTKNLYGDYSPITSSHYKTNVEDGIKQIATHVHKARGCNDPTCTHYDSASVISQLNNVDLIFVAIGTGQAVEREGRDKYDYNLPGHQKDLVTDVLSHAHNKPVIVLLFTGSQLDINFIDEDDRVSAIVECFLPAQATGNAIRHMLLNDAPGAVPAGRLPFTWWHLVQTYGDINNYDMQAGDGKTYRYYKGSGDPLYPFGYGLSYTHFRYSGLTYDHIIQAGHDLHGSVVVHNEGHVDADEAVQVYISWGDNSLPAPVRQLAWFDRVPIPKGGQKTVHFTVEAKTMALWVNNGWKISPTSMKLYVGGQQPNQARSVGSNVLQATFTVEGTKHLQSLVG
nr:hypothetical protein BaRGS_004125 [Batillaria attramentaria]